MLMTRLLSEFTASTLIASAHHHREIIESEKKPQRLNVSRFPLNLRFHPPGIQLTDAFKGFPFLHLKIIEPGTDFRDAPGIIRETGFKTDLKREIQLIRRMVRNVGGNEPTHGAPPANASGLQHEQAQVAQDSAQRLRGCASPDRRRDSYREGERLQLDR
ncbi:hypothetical protein [uncultured Sutterella sp.]|uniref:hypothetical protein n=1 Tax=uncultured Sutterella sp. TaxID=286133 RepID=UPI0025D9B063|nr:hypothetical protein [uncultured Sutterella sp.]